MAGDGMIPQGSGIEAYRELIESVLKLGGTHRFEDVVNAVADGSAMFWPGPHSVIITQIIDYPLAKVLFVWITAGKMDEIQRMAEVITQWAIAQGCNRIMLTGRKGWSRSFLTQQMGWKSTAVCMEKHL